MNIDCTKWRELASDYLEGTLPPDMQNAVTVHLRGCTKCRQDEVALQAINRELNVLPEVDPPLFFRENIISTIEREGKRPIGSWWTSLWSGHGRIFVGTSLTAAAAAALTFAVLMPKANTNHGPAPQNASFSALANNSSSSPAAVSRVPELHLTKVLTVLPGEEPAWDFSFNLLNATTGTARFRLGGDDRDYRFQLNGTNSQTLRIPATVLREKKVLELRSDWTADEASHTRYLLYPVPTENEPVADVRQSFGLPEMNVPDLAREMVAHYRQPIILDDIPNNLMVRLTARDEAADQTLRRQLSDYGLTVTSADDGIHIQKSKETPATKP